MLCHESQESTMNRFTAPQTYESFVLDRAVHASTRAATGSLSLPPQKEYSLRSPTAGEPRAFWSQIYDLRGGALQPWALPESTEARQVRQAQTAQAVEDAIIAERNRLARELHDAVTQTLFAASLIAEVLPDLWELDEAEAHKSTEELRQLTRGALAEMRTLLFELRPAALSQARLPDLLRQLGEAVMGRKLLPIHLHVDGDCELPGDVKVEMYRIAQESLNNIVKYARATRVEINVRMAAGQVQMEIKDDGLGFDTACVKPTSLGLRIMHERAEAIHAQVQVDSQPGRGTTVRLDWHE
jgi:signal transduction histidine kinase